MDAVTSTPSSSSRQHNEASPISLSSANGGLPVTWWAINVPPSSSEYAKPRLSAERVNSCPRTRFSTSYEPSRAAYRGCPSSLVSRQSCDDAGTWGAYSSIHEPRPGRPRPASKRSYRTVTDATSSTFWSPPSVTPSPSPSTTPWIHTCSTNIICTTQLVKTGHV